MEPLAIGDRFCYNFSMNAVSGQYRFPFGEQNANLPDHSVSDRQKNLTVIV